MPERKPIKRVDFTKSFKSTRFNNFRKQDQLSFEQALAFIEEEDIEETVDEDQDILTKQLYLEENSCEENNLSENEDADESVTSANLELQPDNFLKLEGARIIDFHYFIAHCLSIMIQIFFYNCGDILGRYFEVSHINTHQVPFPRGVGASCP
jgi:hypothetical protein